MNIDPKNATSITGGSPQVSGPARAAARSGGAGAPTAGDRLEFSGRAEAFRRARPRLDALPDTGRAQRVAELKAAVANDTYKVSGQTIADAMVSDEATARVLGFDTPR